MSTKSSVTLLKSSFSSFRDLLSVIGSTPYLSGDELEKYIEMGERFRQAIKPRDFIEETMVNDITYNFFEVLRLRRLKNLLIDASKIEGARKLIERLSKSGKGDEFWPAWASGDPDAVEYVNSILIDANIPSEAIKAQTIEVILDELEQFERQTSQFEARKLVTIRDLEHRRDVIDARGGQKSKDDSKFKKRNDNDTKACSHVLSGIQAD